MPKFLAGCHYNEEETSRHLTKKHIGYWPVQMNGNKFATGRSCEGVDFRWLSPKVSRDPDTIREEGRYLGFGRLGSGSDEIFGLSAAPVANLPKISRGHSVGCGLAPFARPAH